MNILYWNFLNLISIMKLRQLFILRHLTLNEVMGIFNSPFLTVQHGGRVTWMYPVRTALVSILKKEGVLCCHFPEHIVLFNFYAPTPLSKKRGILLYTPVSWSVDNIMRTFHLIVMIFHMWVDDTWRRTLINSTKLIMGL
jgi:hypothetical protein